MLPAGREVHDGFRLMGTALHRATTWSIPFVMKPTDSSDHRAEATEGGRPPQGLDKLQQQVVGAVSRTCPAWLARQADDIVQNIMIQLVATLRRGDGKTGFSRVYLAKAAFGATMDEIRRQARRREATNGESVVVQTPARSANPEREAYSGETLRAIQDCLSRLSRSRRLAVTLYLQGCSVPETGRRMHWKRKSAENFVFRGLTDLRRCLQTKGVRP